MIRPRRSLPAIFGLAILWAALAAGKDRGPAVQKAPEDFAAAGEAIRAAGLRSEGGYELLKALCGLGPRLPGSEGAARAVEWARRTLEAGGFETWLEPVTVPHWIRGKEEALIFPSAGGPGTPIAATALGGSVPTAGPGLAGAVVEVRSFEELDRPGISLKGRIVFFNRAVDRSLIDTFRAYGEAAQFRVRGASEAGRRGAAAVLVRSATGRLDDHPHTGIVSYDPDAPKIPAAAISTQAAELLSARLKEDPRLTVRLALGCRTLPDAASANVVGQIRGSELPGEIVLLGAHLDSWDLATGAQDDGAGCAHCLEALRLIREYGPAPKRTIRVVLFMNEEFGASGGRDYAASPRRRGERHIAAMESDRGAGVPVGFESGGGPAVLAGLRAWAPLLATAGAAWLRPGGGGADIGPLAPGGTVLMNFVPDVQRYFDFHHSALDTLDSVHPRELELGAVVMAVMAVALAGKGI